MLLKRYLIPVLVAVLLQASCGPTSSTITFHNYEYGYSIGYPQTWTVDEERDGRTVTFRPSHNQMEITVNVDDEEALEGLPLELVVQGLSTNQTELGAEVYHIDWSDQAIETFAFIETDDWKSWVKTYYIMHNGNFYIVVFKALGYSAPEFEWYRAQLNGICESLHIDGFDASLPEGRTIFDF